MEKVFKQNKGITLIALVITIIVLLILAGISIAMLSGNNSILQQAGNAREITGKKSVIESAQTDILGQITENKGTNITKEQLAAILNKYFKNVDENNIPDEVSSTNDVTLQTIDENYTIKLSQIYIGFLANNRIPNITKNRWKEKLPPDSPEDIIPNIYKFNTDGSIAANTPISPSCYELIGTTLNLYWDLEKNHLYMSLEYDGKKFNNEYTEFEEFIPEIIMFSIDSANYRAEDWMLWDDWINSEYNVDGYIVSGSGNVYSASMNGRVYGNDGNCKGSDKLVSGWKYGLDTEM